MDYLTVEQVAELLHISKSTAYKLFRTIGFPCTKIGRQYLISREMLNKYINNHIGTEVHL